MKVEVKIITQEIAKALLEKNTSNRPLSKDCWQKIALEMERGEWMENGDSIRIAKDGTLLDGQHRLTAIAKTGIPQQYIVISELPNEVFKTIDRGNKRTVGHMLAVQHYKHANCLSAAAKIAMLYYQTGNPANNNYLAAPSASEMIEWIESNPHIMTTTDAVRHMPFVSRFVGASAAAACLFIFERFDGCNAGRFFNELESGIYSYDNSPVQLLRDRLMFSKTSSVKMKKAYIIALVFKAFREFREGGKLGVLKVKLGSDGAIPKEAYSL